MANKWGKQAWDKVSHTTMAKCFKKTGLYPDSDNTDEDPFEGEELQDVTLPPLWIGLMHHAIHENTLSRKMN